MSLWTAEEAAKATGGEARGNWAVDGVSIDTRTLEPGDLFVALKDVRDGHDFVTQALAKGAGAALVNRIPDGVAEDAPLLIVEDVLEALERLGAAGRARCSARVVAVTGSVGKTSTKEMLRVILAGQGKTHAAEASYNNQWGVPLTLARMPADSAFAVIEIGMNHPGEIAPLVRLARPHVAVITNVAAVHLAAFAGVEEIAREKAAIFEGLEPGGVAVVNHDIETAPILEAAAQAAGAELVTFGATPGAQIRAEEINLTGNATVVRGSYKGEKLLFKLAVPGRHFALNGLAALVAAEHLGADFDIAAVDIAGWHPPSGRGTSEVILLDPVEELSFTLIDDAFNASPGPMAAALEVLAASRPLDGVGRIEKGRRIAVLGDMLELGEDELAIHAALADLPFMAKVDIVHCVGPLMHALWARLPVEKQGQYTETADEMVGQIHHLVDAGDVLLVKGSKGSYVSRVVDAVRKLSHPLDG